MPPMHTVLIVTVVFSGIVLKETSVKEPPVKSMLGFSPSPNTSASETTKITIVIYANIFICQIYLEDNIHDKGITNIGKLLHCNDIR